MNKDTRIVFDDDFYRLSAVMLSDKFKNKELVFLEHLDKIGCPIPEERFKTTEEYYLWVELYASKIANDPEADTPDSFLESLLFAFNLDPKSERYLLRLKWKFFFNRDIGPVISVSNHEVKWEQEELWLKLPEWTKQEDYEFWWGALKKELQKYKKRNEKEKSKTSFQRDFLLYQLYKERLKQKKLNHKKGSLLINLFNDSKFIDICEEHGYIQSPQVLKNIISYFGRLLRNIPIVTS